MIIAILTFLEYLKSSVANNNLMEKKVKKVFALAITFTVIICLAGATVLPDKGDNLVNFPLNNSCGTPTPDTTSAPILSTDGEMRSQTGTTSKPDPQAGDSPNSTETPAPTHTPTSNPLQVSYWLGGGGGGSKLSGGTKEDKRGDETPTPAQEGTTTTTTTTTTATTTTTTATTPPQEPEEDGDGLNPSDNGGEVTEVPEFPTMVIPVLIIVAAVFLKTRN